VIVDQKFRLCNIKPARALRPRNEVFLAKLSKARSLHNPAPRERENSCFPAWTNRPRLRFNTGMSPLRTIQSGWLAVLATAAAVLSVGAAPADEYRDEIRPILEKHCFECHGPEKQKGKLNLAAFSEYEKVLEEKETWQFVLERIQAFEMPPEGKPEMGFTKQQKLVKWLRTLPRPERPDCDLIASDRSANFYRGYVMSRRINRAEYNNTIRDLFGVDLQLEELLPADGGGGEGFDTTGNALFVSSIHIEKYLAAATRTLETIVPDNANNLRPEIAAARARLLSAKPTLFTPSREAARKIMTPFARRAFRRPVAADEVDRMLSMFDRGFQRGDGFVPSLRMALKAVLISPNFLFLAEPEPSEGGVHRLSALPLASKMSYYLWSSMPDEELFTLAERGQLLETNVFRQQLQRMLADPKAAALGERFAAQWLDLDRLGTEVHPDPKRYPEFDAELNTSMRQEVTAFFNHVFREDRSLLDLIDSDYTFVNQRLAQIYGINGVVGSEWTRVKLADRNRGGVVGMAAVHASTSYPLRTSPVLRGKWILESLLGEKVKPPPEDVPPLEESPEKVAHQSLRAQLETHRLKAECAACHDKMDPLGFALENFDVLGRWRDQDRDQPIDAKGTLSSGETFSGPAGLKSVLMARKDEVIRHLVKKMVGFAYGRELNRFDDCVVDKTLKALQENNYRASVLVEQIATSYPFQHRFYPKQDMTYETK
jgi:mono/diheme cytochrome c family protein